MGYKDTIEANSNVTPERRPVRNNEMNLAWQFIANTSVSVFLTGKAGTGKTTFLHKLKELTPKRMVVLAPTGVAAINAGGQTIHSFFQLPFGPIVPGRNTEQQKKYSMSGQKKALIRSLDLVVIDEISMVRCDLLDAIDAELRKYRDRTKPFGGVQLLLIGDLQQLAPVAKDSEWTLLSPYYSTPYFFGSKALQQVQYVTVELKHIYRQQDDSTFINILGRIRSGQTDEATLRLLNSRHIPGFRPPQDEDWIRLTTHNNMANDYNSHQLSELPSQEHTFHATIRQNFPETSYPADATLVLKTGAQVMFIKNDTSGGGQYYNGKIGLVVGFQADGIVVKCKGDVRNIIVPTATWENTRYVVDPVTKEVSETIDGTFTQYPLRLAWAITVHKSQGLTFDHAIIDIAHSFAHGQVYVALSRCRTLAGMVLARPLELSAIITDESVNAYIDKELSEAQYSAQKLPQLQFDYYLSLLDEMFSFDTLYWDFRHFVRVVDEHLYSSFPTLLHQMKEALPRIETELTAVAAKFRQQYQNMAKGSANITRDETLQARIKAAARYFSLRIEEIFSDIIQQKNISITNKAVSNRYNNALETFMQSYKLKFGVMKRAVGDGFSVKTYLNNKAVALLEDLKPTKNQQCKKTEKTESGASHSAAVAKPSVGNDTSPKARHKKGDSQRLSLQLFLSGKSVSDIAAERKLSTATIESHLAEFVSTGQLKADDLVSLQHQKFIRGVVRSFDKAYTLTDIKALLPDNYTYFEIKVVLADMNRNQAQQR